MRSFDLHDPSSRFFFVPCLRLFVVLKISIAGYRDCEGLSARIAANRCVPAVRLAIHRGASCARDRRTARKVKFSGRRAAL